jgi:hypothetical protein
MLDLALRTNFRNFSTFFLLAATVMLPLHLGYSFAYQDVIASSAIHDDIALLEEDEKVQGVSPSSLDSSRLALLAIDILGLALIPLVVAAAAAVLAQDAAGRVPGAWRAWRSAEGAGLLRGLRTGPGTLAVGAALALAVWLMASVGGRLLLELGGANDSWAAVGFVRGLTRSFAIPFVAIPWAMAARTAKGTSPSTPNLY